MRGNDETLHSTCRREMTTAPPVYLVVLRHAERADVVNNTTESDSALTDHGRESVAAAVTRLAGQLAQHDALPSSALPLSIAVSPFRRTLQTARAFVDTGLAALGVADADDVEAMVDPMLSEVYGPYRIKGLEPPLVAYLEDFPRIRLPADREPLDDGYVRLAPCDWGEDGPAAHTRYTEAFYLHGEALHEEGGGVRVLVTHGDALQAIVNAVQPGRVVYECDYLGFSVFRQRRPGGPWRMLGCDGVAYIEDEDVVNRTQQSSGDEADEVNEAAADSDPTVSRKTSTRTSAVASPREPLSRAGSTRYNRTAHRLDGTNRLENTYNGTFNSAAPGGAQPQPQDNPELLETMNGTLRAGDERGGRRR
jgi:broad specificity phosphatase PhoE